MSLIVIGALVGVAWLVYHSVEVQMHPIRRCPSCKGTKKNAGSNHLRWGTCSRCGGKGEVPRFGRRE